MKVSSDDFRVGTGNETDLRQQKRIAAVTLQGERASSCHVMRRPWAWWLPPSSDRPPGHAEHRGTKTDAIRFFELVPYCIHFVNHQRPPATASNVFVVVAFAVPRKSRTTRPATLPCSSRSKMSLMAVSGCNSMSALTLPSAANARVLGHVFTGPDEGTANGDTFRDNIKQRHGEISRWQADQGTSAAFASHADALPEGGERRRCDQNAVGTAAGALHNGFYRVRVLRIHHEVRAHLFRQRELAVVYVHSTH